LRVNFSCRCSRKYEGYDGIMQPVTRSVRVGLVEESGMSSEPAKTNHSTDQSSASGNRFSVIDAVRAFGVVLGPSLVLDLFAAFGTLAVASGWPLRPREGLARLLRPLVILGALLPWAYAFLIRPWHLRWGATDEDFSKPLPGDELVPDPGIESTRAISVNAPVEEVWPWLAQIGQDRGGFYSYEWLENLAGCRMRNADRIHPAWQHREVGEIVFLHPATGMKVATFEAGRAIVLEGWGAFVVEPIDEESTRVLLRTRVPRGAVLYYLLGIEIPHFIMEQRMLKGIKERAEMRGLNPNPAVKLSRAALAFRAAHAAIALEQLLAIAYVWWCALTGRRDRLLHIAAASLIGEGVLVSANRGDCPLGGLQDRLGDPVPLFELVLSPRAAKKAVPTLGAIAAAGLVLLVVRGRRDAR
jgi:hypothetical protein